MASTRPEHMPQFPLYIPSKGRAEWRFTPKALAAMGVPYRIVIEESDWKAYSAVEPKKNLLVLDMEYKRKYELCDELGLTKSTGSGPARNFIWDHSISEGWSHHWIMDDNIRYFCRMHGNNRVKATTGAIWRAMEDFVLRYRNVAMAGPNYMMFAFCEHMERLPPFVLNTRIYSCNLIRNDVPFRWRGRYNEDTILSLDMLKAGWCTILFNAFLQNKLRTCTIGGGNTTELYGGGTMPKSKMLCNVHPDVSKLVWKYQRWYHHVDYTPFKNNRLVRRDDVTIPTEPNEYGMRLAKGLPKK